MWQLWVVASCRLVCPINIAYTRTAVSAGSGKRELSDKLRKQNTRMTKIVSSVSMCEQQRPSQLEAPLYRRCSKLVVSACVCVVPYCWLCRCLMLSKWSHCLHLPAEHNFVPQHSNKHKHKHVTVPPWPPGKPHLVPGPPDSQSDVVTIRWDPPPEDGGAPITGRVTTCTVWTLGTWSST
jgi:hypothetical protein